MKYMGSKNRMAKKLIPIIQSYRKVGQVYVEPFCGGANIIDKVKGERLGSDVNKYVIALLKQMQLPLFEAPLVDKDLYNKVKENKHHYEDFLVGYVGTQLTYGSQWFGSYRSDSKGVRDYSVEAKNNVDKQAAKLKDSNLTFTQGNYKDIELPTASLVYCDPPYNTINMRPSHYYNGTDTPDIFDSAAFWEWCRCSD